MEASTRRPRDRYVHLVTSEREIIRRLAHKQSVPQIAKLLGKHRSTVWRELKRNTNAGGQYYEVHAEGMRRRRRLKSRELFRVVENDLVLENYIERMLRFGLSPEQITGYMRRSQQDRQRPPSP